MTLVCCKTRGGVQEERAAEGRHRHYRLACLTPVPHPAQPVWLPRWASFQLLAPGQGQTSLAKRRLRSLFSIPRHDTHCLIRTPPPQPTPVRTPHLRPATFSFRRRISAKIETLWEMCPDRSQLVSMRLVSIVGAVLFKREQRLEANISDSGCAVKYDFLCVSAESIP